MSYCRWSSDDFQCDVYVYESPEGFVTHVASSRVVFSKPLPPPVDMRNVAEFLECQNKVMEMVDTADRKPIGLPHDGQDFLDATPGDAADTLKMLMAEGYRVPQYAIDALLEEERETP